MDHGPCLDHAWTRGRSGGVSSDHGSMVTMLLTPISSQQRKHRSPKRWKSVGWFPVVFALGFSVKNVAIRFFVFTQLNGSQTDFFPPLLVMYSLWVDQSLYFLRRNLHFASSIWAWVKTLRWKSLRSLKIDHGYCIFGCSAAIWFWLIHNII